MNNLKEKKTYYKTIPKKKEKKRKKTRFFFRKMQQKPYFFVVVLLVFIFKVDALPSPTNTRPTTYTFVRDLKIGFDPSLEKVYIQPFYGNVSQYTKEYFDYIEKLFNEDPLKCIAFHLNVGGTMYCEKGVCEQFNITSPYQFVAPYDMKAYPEENYIQPLLPYEKKYAFIVKETPVTMFTWFNVCQKETLNGCDKWYRFNKEDNLILPYYIVLQGKRTVDITKEAGATASVSRWKLKVEYQSLQPYVGSIYEFVFPNMIELLSYIGPLSFDLKYGGPSNAHELIDSLHFEDFRVGELKIKYVSSYTWLAAENVVIFVIMLVLIICALCGIHDRCCASLDDESYFDEDEEGFSEKDDEDEE